MLARTPLAVPITVLALAGCGGSAPPPAEEPTPVREEASVGEAPPVEEETAREETPPAPSPPPLPALTANDPHTRVLGVVPGSCRISGVADGGVFVASYGGPQQGSALTRLSLASDAAAAPAVVHQGPGQLEYRIGGGHAGILETSPGFGTATIRVVPLAGGEPVEVARQIRQSTWLVGPDGVYWGDPSFTEPHLQRVPFTGGEPTTVEELRPVFDEDRLEQLLLTDAGAVFVAVRTRQNQGGGYFCHELRGGPLGESRTLRRYRRCPSDEELISALSASAEHAYYFRDTGFFRVSLAAGRSTPREEVVDIDVRSLPTGSATDGRVLVWSSSDGMFRRPVSGAATPETIGEGSRRLGAPTIAAGNVLWTRSDEGAPCVVLARPIDAPPLAPPG